MLAALCCASAPAASPAVAGDTTRTWHLQPNDSDSPSPDPIAAFLWFATLTTTDRALPVALPDIGVTRTDAALTYLRTLRLRL
jgi:hypothetical protein